MYMWLCARVCALLVATGTAAAPAAALDGAAVSALDGGGQPVAWWAVLKLPAHVHADATMLLNSTARPTPCDCAPPDCAGLPTAHWAALESRASGLCYLYADAREPTFRHFRDLGYDCLGQGGKDPLSQTLRQQSAASDTGKTPYWAIFNDQFNGIAAAFQPGEDRKTREDKRNVCGGGDAFSAHAKGAVAFRGDASGGFFLQTSTPNYPDPTRSASSQDTQAFVPLGCQADNNVQFAQHIMALSLDDSALQELGTALQLARLCSGNFFRTSDLHDGLASTELYADGPTAAKNSSVAAFYHALLDPALPEQHGDDPMTAELRLKLKTAIMTTDNGPETAEDAPEAPQLNWPVFEPLQATETLETHVESAGEEAQDIGNELEDRGEQAEEVEVLVKSPRAAVPPWALVAETLESDVSVASWWDGSYGIPSICAGDTYTLTPQHFCLDDPAAGVQLNPDGSAPYNIENLLRATWRMTDGSGNLTWQLVGGRTPDGNHAKWGLTTPRSGLVDPSKAYVTFGDLNMEGFPCSKSCNGSQAGRGGSFFSFLRPSLHRSLTQSLISDACRCSPPTASKQSSLTSTQAFTAAPTMSTFEELRMCHRGCVKKLDKYWDAAELPLLSANASSFWV